MELNKDDFNNLIALFESAYKELRKAEQIVKKLSSPLTSDINDVVVKYLNNSEDIINWIKNALPQKS